MIWPRNFSVMRSVTFPLVRSHYVTSDRVLHESDVLIKAELTVHEADELCGLLNEVDEVMSS